MFATENEVVQTFKNAGQSHVFESYSVLSLEQKKALLAQASQIDLPFLHSLASKFLPVTQPTSHTNAGHILPPKALRLPQNGGDPSAWNCARTLGERYLTAGKIAVLTVAGGHGTRLGITCPKGTFSVTPIKEKSLFQVFAEKIVAAQNKYDCVIHWFIMTSFANHEDTLEFFNQHNYFRLSPNHIHFFQQSQMPAIDFEGKIIMESPASISMSPDGHGGSFYALKNHKLLDYMAERNIEIISYHQVDNPLAKIIDPAFIGFHIEAQSDFSSKMVPKTKPEEREGLFCIINGQLQVIEYSDFPSSLVDQRDPNGRLTFDAANVAIHLFNRTFVETVTEKQGLLESLPYHRAIKTIPAFKEVKAISPKEPNGIRFERFIFDALPLAHNPILIETERTSEFSPVKNNTGPDSLETCLKDQRTLFLSWISHALPDETLATINKIEVSPLFADSKDDFVKKWAQQPQIVSPEANELYIE